MTDRIKQMAEEAHNYADHVTFDNPEADWNDLFNAKFAALVAEDCARIADDKSHLEYDDRITQQSIVDAIRARYGIKGQS